MQNAHRYAKSRRLKNKNKMQLIPLSLGNATLLKARLDTLGNAGWDRGLKLCNIGSIDGLSKGSRHHIRTHSKQLISDLAGAKIFTVKACYKGRGRAVRVELGVNGALIEWLHLEGIDRIGDNSPSISGNIVVKDAVLREHLSDQPTTGNNLELSPAGVDMRCVETTGAQEADCHAAAGTNESGECLAVRGNEISTLSSLAFESWVAEIEDELAVLWEEGESIHRGIGKEKLLCKTESRSGGGCCGGGLGSGCAGAGAGAGACGDGGILQTIWHGGSSERGGSQDGSSDDLSEMHIEDGKLSEEIERRNVEKTRKGRLYKGEDAVGCLIV